MSQMVNRPIKSFAYEPEPTARWHTWSIEITPHALNATWDERELPPVTAADSLFKLNTLAKGRLGKARDPDRKEPPPVVPTFTEPAFGPGLGLYVSHGAATFRNVRLVPVR